MSSNIETRTASHLRIEGLICCYGAIRAVDQVDLTITPGEHVALIGSNGSGKTTLLRAILGLQPIAQGKVILNGFEATTAPEWHARRRRIAWMPQRQATGQFPLLVHELLASSLDEATARTAAEQLGVADLLARPLHQLSGGQLQRAFLARALGSLAGGAGLLLADEPTAALDFAGQEAVAKVIAQLPATVVVVTHDRTMADHCGRVAEMASGRLREVAR